MRSLILSLLCLFPMAVVAAADPPKYRVIKVGDTIVVPVNTDGDDVKQLFLDSNAVEAKASKNPDKKHILVTIKGLAEGDAEVLVDAVIYYQILIRVVSPEAIKAPPGNDDFPVVPLKKVPVPEAPVPQPPGAKPTAPAPKTTSDVSQELDRLLAIQPKDKPADPSVTAVKVVRQRGNLVWNGSGTVIDSRKGQSLILTNEHVAPRPDAKFSIEIGGFSYPANWLGSDADADLAMLVIGHELPAATLSYELPPRGAYLQQYGHAGGGPIKPKAGISLGLDAPNSAESAMSASYKGELGESGCGVFDAKGRMVAVFNARDTATWNASCVPLSRAKSFLGKFCGQSYSVAPQAVLMPAQTFVVPAGASACPGGKCPSR